MVLVCDECATLQAMVECNECTKVCPCFSMHSFATRINDGMMKTLLLPPPSAGHSSADLHVKYPHTLTKTFLPERRLAAAI